LEKARTAVNKLETQSKTHEVSIEKQRADILNKRRESLESEFGSKFEEILNNKDSLDSTELERFIKLNQLYEDSQYRVNKSIAQRNDLLKNSPEQQKLNDFKEKIKNIDTNALGFDKVTEAVDRTQKAIAALNETTKGTGEYSESLSAVKNYFAQIETAHKNFQSIQEKGVKLDVIPPKALSNVQELIDKTETAKRVLGDNPLEKMEVYKHIDKSGAESYTAFLKVQNDELKLSSDLLIKLNSNFEQLNVVKGNASEGTVDIAGLEKAASDIEKMQYNMSKMRINFGAAFKPGSEMEQHWDNLKKLIDSASKAPIPEAVKELNTQYGLLSAKVQSTGKAQKNFFDLMENQTRRFAGYLASAFSVGQLVSQGKQMVQSIKDIDEAQVRLQRVTDLSGASLERFTQRAFEAGQAIGRTGKDVMDAVTEFRRAGFELEQSFQMAQGALMMTNIGDGIRDVADASSSLIAVLRGFEFDESQYARVIDSINEVDKLAS